MWLASVSFLAAYPSSGFSCSPWTYVPVSRTENIVSLCVAVLFPRWKVPCVLRPTPLVVARKDPSILGSAVERVSYRSLDSSWFVDC